MTEALPQVVVCLNAAANLLGKVLDFIGLLPGWLSITLIAVLSGLGFLLAFKYTSHQQAIKKARQQIRSSLLSVRLFFDSPWVGFRGQAGALLGALKLLLLAVVPILALIIPVTLLLVQLGLWYQARPLHVGEEAVITLKLGEQLSSSWPKVVLEPSAAVEDTHGPVRVFSEHEVCWNVRAAQNGQHTLLFRVDGQSVQKELAVGDALMRVSQRRPEWNWSDILLHPAETPFPPDAPVSWIEVEYPARSSWISGANTWVYYWFAVSLVVGFLCRGIFRVNL
jgi:hypothetical protein